MCRTSQVTHPIPSSCSTPETTQCHTCHLRLILNNNRKRWARACVVDRFTLSCCLLTITAHFVRKCIVCWSQMRTCCFSPLVGNGVHFYRKRSVHVKCTTGVALCSLADDNDKDDNTDRLTGWSGRTVVLGAMLLRTWSRSWYTVHACTIYRECMHNFYVLRTSKFKIIFLINCRVIL